FADAAIAARDAAFETSVTVHERQRHAVQLQLAHVFEIGAPAEFMHAPLPVEQFLFAIGIVEREHWRGMLRLHEALTRFAAYALCGGVGRDEFWIFRFEPLKLVH